MAKGADAPGGGGNEDDVDGCPCDIESPDRETTPDAELPAAQGGVEITGQQYADEDHIDGCDVDFNEGDATTDEELPVAVGGVA